MTVVADTADVAPVLVARIAGWPVATVAALGTQAGAFDGHAARLEVERRRLWASTVDDPRFMCALALVNPPLARRLLGAPLPVTRGKRARHDETTLYRYLARAVARTEPGGLWCGVAPARFAEERRATPAAPAFVVTPDLAPFRRAFHAVTRAAHYRARARYKLNPTLDRNAVAQDEHVYWAPSFDRPPSQRRLRASLATARVLGILARREVWTLPEASAALGTDAVSLLLEGGVLVGGPAFPRRFADAWEALALAEAELIGSDAAAWSRAIVALRDVASNAEAAIAACDPGALLDHMDRAGATVASLVATLEVAVTLPRAVLRCDTRAPWALTLGHGDARRVADAIDHHALHGAPDLDVQHAALAAWLGEGSRLATVAPPVDAPLADAPPADAPCPTWEALAARFGPGDGGLERFPLGAVRFSFAGDALVLHAIAPDAAAAFARLGATLGASGEVLVAWTRRQVRDLEAAFDVELVDVAFDHPEPNVIARPPLCGRALDPWGPPAAPGHAEREVTPGALAVVREASAYFVRVAGAMRPLAAFAPTAATPPWGDPCVSALLATSGRVPPEIIAGGAPVSAEELAVPGHRPRITREDGTIVRPRRTVLHGAELVALLAARGEARFVAWRALVERHRWPALVTLQREGQPPLLVPCASALAVEAALEGAGGTRCLRVEEVVRGAWIRSGGGDAYVAELVLPVVWRRHGWSGRARRAAVAADQPRAAGA